MYKVTVLYKYVEDTEQFEKYYQEKHLPIAKMMPKMSKIELTKFEVSPGGGKPEYYRMAELYYSSYEVMQESMGSFESQAVIDDLSYFATAGVTVLMGSVEMD